VVPVSSQEVESVMETRMLVEQFALAKAIARGRDVTGELEAAIARQVAHAARGDSEAFVEADREFHTVFVTAAGNPIVASLYDSLRDRQRRMGVAALTRDERRVSSILAEHRALVAAVRARDPERARKVLADHLQGTLELLRSGS